jgi:hypothetical protein
MVTTATKTLDDAITEIRMIINDNDLSAPRYTQDLVLSKINTALRDVYKYRPDAFIGNFTQGVLTNNPVSTFEDADIGTALPWPVDDRFFFSPVVMYVAGILDLSDDEFSDDNRAMTLLTSFKQQLGGMGG